MPGDNPDPLNSSIEVRIDAALGSYAEPPAAISDPRTAAAAILDRAHVTPTRRPFWIWAIPAACLLALAVGLLWWFHAAPAPRIARAVAPAPAGTVPLASAPAPHRLPVRIVRRQHAHPAPLPKLDVFPTPAPLSPQEQALVAFARTAPPAVQQAVIDDQRSWDQPPNVAGLNINPPENSGAPKTEMEAPKKENR
ncbi:MAG: hypothetical protein WBG54_14505 [Acidobacteriaceae bacterium]